MGKLRLTTQFDLAGMPNADLLRGASEGAASTSRSRTHALRNHTAYRSVGYEIDGVLVGGAVFDGCELHLALLPQYCPRWAWLLKPTLDWLFTVRDPVAVRINRDSVRCLRFMDACGWARIAEEEHFIVFLLSSSQPGPMFRPS